MGNESENQLRKDLEVLKNSIEKILDIIFNKIGKFVPKVMAKSLTEYVEEVKGEELLKSKYESLIQLSQDLSKCEIEIDKKLNSKDAIKKEDYNYYYNNLYRILDKYSQQEIFYQHRNKIFRILNKLTKPLSYLMGKSFRKEEWKKHGFFRPKIGKILEKSMDRLKKENKDILKSSGFSK